MGMCSWEDYEDSKAFLVTPDRLCVGAVYAFACRARPSLSWQACRFPARIAEVTKVSSDEVPYVVSMSFANAREPAAGAAADRYLFGPEGLMLLPDDNKGLEEAHLQHRFEKLDDELQSIEDIKTVGFRVETVPFVAPRGV